VIVAMSLFIVILIHFLYYKVEASELCPHIIINSQVDLNLSSVEKRSLCGDPKVKAYSDIPAYQAKYFMKGFLQSRGYLNPQFEINDEILYVSLGEKKEVNQVTVEMEDDSESAKLIDKEIERIYSGRTLTPVLLNEIEEAALDILQRNSYPCAKIESTVDAETADINLSVNNLTSYNFGEIQKEPLHRLADTAFDRFYPFLPEDSFDQRLLTLTEKRMLRAEIVQGTYFLKKCQEDLFTLKQQFIFGPPRSFRFGVGASTEVGPMTRIRWANHRYGKMASLLSANIQVSLVKQAINLTSDQFFWEDHPRRSMYTEINLTRNSLPDYEEVNFELKPHLKWTRDALSRHWLWSIGPTYETGYFTTDEKATTTNFSTGAVEGSLQWMTHIYELFDFHPEDGSLYRFNFDYRHPVMGFENQLLKFDNTFVKLFRIHEWGRGWAVGGIRMNVATSWVNHDVNLNDLPPSLKLYGGGSDDVRGFTLNTLPKNSGLGALTKLGTKLELRKTYFYKETLEAFTFIDMAYLGERSWMLDKRLWYSPGFGMRWLSPIGLIQGYVARGLATRPDKDFGNFFYLGIGGQF
jgi:translocation and assembly module TamA